MNSSAITIDLNDPGVSNLSVDALIQQFRAAQAMTRKADGDNDISFACYELATASENMAFWAAVEAVASARRILAGERYDKALREAVEFAA